MVGKRDQNRSEKGQAKVEGEDKIKLGTVAPANKVIEESFVNQERSMIDLQMNVAEKEREKPKQLEQRLVNKIFGKINIYFTKHQFTVKIGLKD